jgi:hypothetical protein
MRRTTMAILIGLALGVAGCGTAGPAPAGAETKEIKSQGRFADPASGCSFALPEGRYRIALHHFPAQLPADKIRHTIRIYTAEQEELARIDLYDDPAALSPESWARRHLDYLLRDRVELSHQQIGPGGLPVLLIRTPRSPQAYAVNTAVIASGKRIAVITASRPDDHERRLLLQKLLNSFSF